MLAAMIRFRTRVNTHRRGWLNRHDAMSDTLVPPSDLGASRGKYTLLISIHGLVQTISLADYGKLTVGRDAENDIVLNDDFASRRHAIIHCGEPPMIEDLSSRNGTSLGGRRLIPGVPLAMEDGASLQMARSIVFVQRSAPGAQTSSSHHSVQSSVPQLPAGVVLRDASMIEVYRLLGTVAPSMLPILILGETGVGKELVLETVHLASRRKGPLVRINCATLTGTMIESELFGYERGAFTGAFQSKIGLIEAADGGTLFLDEIGELPFSFQAKLLRVLEQREVLRIGATKPRIVDVRFVAATNQDLRKGIAEGSFRADLYHRLNGAILSIPPLRRRSNDVVPLAEHFVNDFATKMNRPPPPFSAEAIELLRQYSWPGNVRELRNTVERATLLSFGSTIETRALSLDAVGIEPVTSVSNMKDAASHMKDAAGYDEITKVSHSNLSTDDGAEDQSKSRLMTDVGERTKILNALRQTAGNQLRAAQLLGISRRTLSNRLDTLGIDRPRKGKCET